MLADGEFDEVGNDPANNCCFDRWDSQSRNYRRLLVFYSSRQDFLSLERVVEVEDLLGRAELGDCPLRRKLH